MTLPPEVRAMLDPSSLEEPNVVVCSSSDLAGNLGETYVAADRFSLFLFGPRLGEAYRSIQPELRNGKRGRFAERVVGIGIDA